MPCLFSSRQSSLVFYLFYRSIYLFVRLISPSSNAIVSCLRSVVFHRFRFGDSIQLSILSSILDPFFLSLHPPYSPFPIVIVNVPIIELTFLLSSFQNLIHPNIFEFSILPYIIIKGREEEGESREYAGIQCLSGKQAKMMRTCRARRRRGRRMEA